MGQIPQVAAAPAGSVQDLLSIAGSADFQDESAVEAKIIELFKEWHPVDLAISGRKVIVVLAVIVAGMNHPEMPG